MYDYQKATYNSPNLFRRFSHRTRFKIGLQLLSNSDNCSILDFGCGDGYFLKELEHHCKGKKNRLIGFEKYPNIYINNNSYDDIVFFYNEIDLSTYLLDKGKFDSITCFEVLEHCSQKTQLEILQTLDSYLKPHGKIIISVPIEIGITAFLKNIFRFRLSPKKRFGGYTFKNIIKSTLYLPIEDYRSREEYLTHMGFDYRDLIKIINKYFIIDKKIYTPLHNVNHVLNSQVFLILTKKK
jgi:SAM-dependent methyltransferase